MNDNKYNNNDPTTNGVNNPDSNSENDLSKENDARLIKSDLWFYS